MNEEKHLLYAIKLHEEISVNATTTVLRTIGGWIYYRLIEDSLTSTFVPDTNIEDDYE